MRENVIISYRGANYELGQWPHGYGIWGADTPQSQPLEGWPATPEGWSAAWYRFAAMEAPGTIQPVSPPVTDPTTPVTPFFAPHDSQAVYGAATASHAAPAGEVVFGRQDTREFPAGPPDQSHAPYGQAYYGRDAAGHGRIAAAPVVISQARGRLAAALLAAGVVLGIVGLFPSYLNGASLASQASSYLPHLFYVAAWALSAGLILRGGTVLRAGALLGIGTSAVTFGLFFADAGTPMAGGGHLAGAGLWIGIIGWAVSAAGALLAFGRWPADWPRRVRGREAAVTATLIIASLGVAIAFAPPWDRFTLTTSAGASQTLTAGNAFANPGPVIVGNVAVMLAVFAVVVAAALWRPARLGWALAAGALVPMVAQAIAAVVQISEPTSPSQFGISPSAAAQAGLKISAGLTGAYWGYSAFVLVLLIGCVWLALSGDRGDPVRPGWTQPGTVAAATAPVGPVGPAGNDGTTSASAGNGVPADNPDKSAGPVSPPSDSAGA